MTSYNCLYHNNIYCSSYKSAPTQLHACFLSFVVLYVAVVQYFRGWMQHVFALLPDQRSTIRLKMQIIRFLPSLFHKFLSCVFGWLECRSCIVNITKNIHALIQDLEYCLITSFRQKHPIPILARISFSLQRYTLLVPISQVLKMPWCLKRFPFPYISLLAILLKQYFTFVKFLYQILVLTRFLIKFHFSICDIRNFCRFHLLI